MIQTGLMEREEEEEIKKEQQHNIVFHHSHTRTHTTRTTLRTKGYVTDGRQQRAVSILDLISPTEKRKRERIIQKKKGFAPHTHYGMFHNNRLLLPETRKGRGGGRGSTLHLPTLPFLHTADVCSITHTRPHTPMRHRVNMNLFLFLFVLFEILLLAVEKQRTTEKVYRLKTKEDKK